MPRIVAIDFGTKRVGLATTDAMQLIASALGTVPTKDAIAYLKSYIEREPVSDFVIGKPLKLDGTNSQSAVHVAKFISLLQKTFPSIPVSQVDERFTSAIATRSLLEMGLKKKDRAKKENIDQVSAVLILQTYLQMKGG
ncbi:MAG: Holliday junction resolvase RuvX [Bacteroidia bacterium]|jgi:putative Holliday junction resolvase|nr:Holliday junction resolvase RuvX [Bacteroidia bacterium]